MSKILDVLANREKLFLTVVIGILIGSLSIFTPITIFCIIVSICAFIWFCVVFYKSPYEFIDIPFLLLVMGTFAFGRAFSILGIEVGIMPFFITEIVLLVTFGLILFRGRIVNFNLYLPPGINGSFIIYLILGTVYLLFGLAENKLFALRDVILCYYVIFTYITVIVLRTEQRLKDFFRFIIPCAVLILIIALIKIFNILPENKFIMKVLLELKPFNINLYAGMILIFSLSFFSYIKRTKNKIAIGILAIASFFVNILLKTSTGWVATIAALSFLIWMFKVEIATIVRKYWILLIVLMISFLAVFFLLCPGIPDDLEKEWYAIWHWDRSTGAGCNIVWRFMLWRQAIRQVSEQPFIGLGFGSQIHYLHHISEGNPARYNIDDNLVPLLNTINPGSGILPIHNHILTIVFKMGFLGLLIFLFINLRIFFYGLFYIRKCKLEFNRRFLIASLVGLVYWHVMALFINVINSPPTSIFLWILLGLVLSVVYVDKQNEKLTCLY